MANNCGGGGGGTACVYRQQNTRTVVDHVDPADFLDNGRCRRYPPGLKVDDVEPDDWCGEWVVAP